MIIELFMCLLLYITYKILYHIEKFDKEEKLRRQRQREEEIAEKARYKISKVKKAIKASGKRQPYIDPDTDETYKGEEIDRYIRTLLKTGVFSR